MSLDIYRLAFARVKGLRPDIAREILSRTGSEEAFMTLSEGQLRAMLGFDGKILGDAYRNGLLEDARRESQFIEAHGLACSYFTDPAYPRRMLECDDARTSGRRIYEYLHPSRQEKPAERHCAAVFICRGDGSHVADGEMWVWNRRVNLPLLIADIGVWKADEIGPSSVGGNIYRNQLAMQLLHQDEV